MSIDLKLKNEIEKDNELLCPVHGLKMCFESMEFPRREEIQNKIGEFNDWIPSSGVRYRTIVLESYETEIRKITFGCPAGCKFIAIIKESYPVNHGNITERIEPEKF